MKTSVPKCLLSIPSCRWQFCLISSWGNWIFNSPSATDKFIMVSDHSVGSEKLWITSTFSFDRWFPRQSKQGKVSPPSNKVWIYSHIKRFDDLHTCWKYFLSSLPLSGARYLCIMTAHRVYSITFTAGTIGSILDGKVVGLEYHKVLRLFHFSVCVWTSRYLN